MLATAAKALRFHPLWSPAGSWVLTPNLARSQVSSMDIDDARLEMITSAARRYVKELGSKLTFEKTTNLSRALRIAD
jgi:alpha-galactosidase/6-phospho-beta-glucosidase family protein